MRGVRLQEARAFARARGERLPTDAERTLLRRELGEGLEPFDRERARFPRGFRTVRSVEEP